MLSLNFLLPEDNGSLRNIARAFPNAWMQYETVKQWRKKKKAWKYPNNPTLVILRAPGKLNKGGKKA